MREAQTCNCGRCGKLLRMAESTAKADAPFKLAKVPDGLCAECVMTEFLYNNYPLNMQLDESGPEILLSPHTPLMLEQSGVMDGSDLKASEVDWVRLVANWRMPVETRRGPKNPYSMGESDRSKHLAYEKPA